jgi:hypothetical protein
LSNDSSTFPVSSSSAYVSYILNTTSFNKIIIISYISNSLIINTRV